LFIEKNQKYTLLNKLKGKVKNML